MVEEARRSAISQGAGVRDGRFLFFTSAQPGARPSQKRLVLYLRAEPVWRTGEIGRVDTYAPRVHQTAQVLYFGFLHLLIATGRNAKTRPVTMGAVVGFCLAFFCRFGMFRIPARCASRAQIISDRPSRFDPDSNISTTPLKWGSPRSKPQSP